MNILETHELYVQVCGGIARYIYISIKLLKKIMALVKSNAQNPARVFLTSKPCSPSVKVDPQLGGRVTGELVKHTDSLAHFPESS